MSLLNAIANVRKPIGAGCSRTAYYSKKYDVVIKKSGYGRSENYVSRQSEQEMELFSKMTEEEKQFFPVVAVIKNCIIMKRCVPLNTLNSGWDGWNLCEQIDNATKKLSLDEDKKNPFLDFCRKYNIGDMHTGNIGILDNHLVIIDAGF